MGEGHLEHVVVGQFLSLDIDSDYVGFDDFHSDVSLHIKENSEQNAHSLRDFAYKDDPPQRILEQYTSLRGPPSLA